MFSEHFIKNEDEAVDQNGGDLSMSEQKKLIDDEFRSFDSLALEQRNSKGERRPGLLSRKMSIYILSSILAFGSVQEALLKTVYAQGKSKETSSLNFDRQTLENRIRQDCQTFTEIIKENGTLEKVSYIKNKFGEAVENFFHLNNISSSLDFYQLMLERSAAGDNKVFVNPDFIAGATPGSRVSYYLDNYWTVFSHEQKNAQHEPIKLSGFEDVPGCSNEVLAAMLKQKYPSAWLQGSIKSIEFIGQVKPYDENTITLGEAREYGVAAMSDGDNRAPLTIYKMPDQQTVADVMNVIDHELGHGNDWENSRILANQERINFLYDVTRRYEQPDHYQSAYVAQVNADDPEAAEYLRIKEYWAELTRVYYGPESNTFKINYPEDAKLVETWSNQISGLE